MTVPVPQAGPGETVRMFVNGQAMRGGTLHAPLAMAGRLLGSIPPQAEKRLRTLGIVGAYYGLDTPPG